MPLTLLLADDHQIVRQGLRALLSAENDLQLVGEAADAPETIRQAAEQQPDVLVLDLMLRRGQGLNGFQVARQVRACSPRTRIVILSMHASEAYVLEAVRAGASAYVVKERGAEDLVRAIRAVAAGKRYFSPPFSEDRLDEYAQKAAGTPPDPYSTLTPREREVLQLTVQGNSSVEIADRLYISSRTVESHRANLMHKLNVRNQKELIRYAVERGLLPAPE